VLPITKRAPSSARSSASASAGRGPNIAKSPATNSASGAAVRRISASTASSATTLPWTSEKIAMRIGYLSFSRWPAAAWYFSIMFFSFLRSQSVKMKRKKIKYR